MHPDKFDHLDRLWSASAPWGFTKHPARRPPAAAAAPVGQRSRRCLHEAPGRYKRVQAKGHPGTSANNHRAALGQQATTGDWPDPARDAPGVRQVVVVDEAHVVRPVVRVEVRCAPSGWTTRAAATAGRRSLKY
jgi:hypothetical protein